MMIEQKLTHNKEGNLCHIRRSGHRRLPLARAAFFAAILLSLTMLTGCGGRRVIFTTGFAGDELFTVGEEVATTSEYKVYFTNLQREYEGIFGEDIWNHAGNEALAQDVKDNALAQLSKVKVLNLMAADAELALDEAEQAKAEQAADTYFASLNDTERAYLNMTSSDAILPLYQEYALAEKEYNSIINTVDSEISDDEARSVTCQQIRILSANYASDADARARAEAILKEIRDGIANLTGVTFDTYISEYNESDTSEIVVSRAAVQADTASAQSNPATASTASSADDSDMASAAASASDDAASTTDLTDQPLEETAFSLAVNEISDVVRTSDGYVILKCIEGYNAEQTQQNKQTILQQRQETAFETAYDNYVQNIDYNIDQDKYDAISLVTDPAITTNSFFSVYTDLID